MAKRIQVTLQDAEYLEIQSVARSCRMSVPTWIRQALAKALQRTPITDVDKKLEAIRAAARHDFPSGDIEIMLGQIEGRSEDGASS